LPPYPLPNNINKRLQCAKIGTPVLCTWRVYFSSDFDEDFGNEFFKKIPFIKIYSDTIYFYYIKCYCGTIIVFDLKEAKRMNLEISLIWKVKIIFLLHSI